MGGFVSRALKINGEYPFEEAKSLRFSYTDDWVTKMVGPDDDPYLFYLKEGDNILTMEVVLGSLAEVTRIMQDSIYTLNTIYRNILTLTGPKPDIYRDYNFDVLLDASIEEMKQQIGIIGAADGPTAIFVANTLGSKYLGAIMVAAYSYMALVPIVQPPVIRLVTTKKERLIRMPYQKGKVSRLTRILFPILVTMIAGIAAPASASLVGFLMFGNLLRECGVLNALSETAQSTLANLITILLGLTVASQMTAEQFVRPDTLLILGLGLVAFVGDTVGGVLFAKFINLFLPEGKKINPMIGAAGISAFPMSGRVVNQMGLQEDNQNFLLMYSISVNVSGQIASVVAGGLILSLMGY